MKLELLLSQYPRQFYEKGTYLMVQEETVDYLFYIFSGSVIGSIFDVNGNEYMFNIISAEKDINSIAGLGMSLVEKSKATFNLLALSDTLCCKIPSHLVHSYLTEHPEQLMKFTSNLMENYINVCQRINSRNALHTIERYCRFILEHSIMVNDIMLLDKKYSNMEISQLIGVHPTTLSRMKAALIQHGCVEKISAGLKICDIPLLEAGAEGLIKFEYRKR